MNSKDTTTEEVNRMTHIELARAWRFAEAGNWITGDPVTERAMERLLNEFGGSNPQLSKQLGWKNE